MGEPWSFKITREITEWEELQKKLQDLMWRANSGAPWTSFLGVGAIDGRPLHAVKLENGYGEKLWGVQSHQGGYWLP